MFEYINQPVIQRKQTISIPLQSPVSAWKIIFSLLLQRRWECHFLYFINFALTPCRPKKRIIVFYKKWSVVHVSVIRKEKPLYFQIHLLAQLYNIGTHNGLKLEKNWYLSSVLACFYCWFYCRLSFPGSKLCGFMFQSNFLHLVHSDFWAVFFGLAAWLSFLQPLLKASQFLLSES